MLLTLQFSISFLGPILGSVAFAGVGGGVGGYAPRAFYSNYYDRQTICVVCNVIKTYFIYS